MREINFEDVRPGDVARSNGKELEVTWRGENRIDVGFEADKFLSKNTADALGVSFWREDRALPTYPGAWVQHGIRIAVRESGVGMTPWLTNDPGDLWKSDAELLEWLGPGWAEESTPPASWVPVDPADIRVGDYVRAERNGALYEGMANYIGTDGEYIGINTLPCLEAEMFTWFKRVGGESDE